MKNIPKHVGIIMDGNRTWAKNRGLPALKGHQSGADNLRNLSKYILTTGVKVLSVFAFSTENFKRGKEEVNSLMDLIIKGLKKFTKEFNENGIKVLISGNRDNLRNDVIETIDEITKLTKNNKNGIFNICLNYGGKKEIVDACKNITADISDNKLDIEKLDEDIFEKYLYNDLPPIDLLIRTSGEVRISNFMIWQLAYAELYFTDTLFPDFNANEFDNALIEYNNRTRKFGG